MSAVLLYPIPAADLLPAELPLYGCPVPAGFPSPADDHQEPGLDLTRHLFRNPASTFLARVVGDSMTGAGIYPGDLIAVDRAQPARDGSIVVAVLDGEQTLKRLRQQPGRTWLEAENDRYAPLELHTGARLEVWGVVTHVIHALEGRPAAVSLREWRQTK
ncbi:LexA family protein [Hymenobacter weizhouensis]|uniref:LexA family protein n=1 Tax=Hymenobacter sp. YIM 151500-1 TaxID=2987689 RepID=UPI002226EE0A|nr:translesion error-prone DNA polymerase V autoproteolytic subunit [Hymenobacter sp. YIM 151500-1]UYZ64789.1 translesion error-prone DNA polymerase V autoproteolytic subunit [Hymenobacter sp. YIM 151500-1]